MDPRPEQEARVRGQPERRAVEAEEWFIHGELPRPLGGPERGLYEDYQFAVRAGRPRFRLEEPAEERNVAEERHLLDGLHHVLLADATDRQGLTLVDDDLRYGRALVDGRDKRGDSAGRRLQDILTPRVVLDVDDHLDPGDVALPDDGRRHVELEQGLLELDLGARRAHRRVRELAAERDRCLGVLERDDLGLRERRRLVLHLERVEDQVDIQLPPDEPEGDAGGGDAGE